MTPTKRILSGALGLVAALVAHSFCATAEAASTINRPGLHPRYDVELEPHLAFAFSHGHRFSEDEGFGPGMRFAIPIVDDGPLSKINNSMAIGFGLDWTHHDGNCAVGDCDSDVFWFPVVLQWNFWLTDMISVFGEPGMAIQHETWDDDYCVDGVNCDTSDTDPRFVFFGGGRFLFSDSIGGVVRLGWPYLSLGATFLL